MMPVITGNGDGVMSFSNETKNELARVFPKKECCQKAELSALLNIGGTLTLLEDNHTAVWEINTENPATARKIFKLAKCLKASPVEVVTLNKRQLKKNKIFVVRGRVEGVGLSWLQELGLVNRQGRRVEKIPEALISRRCCKRAYLRGAFLARGSVNKPEGEYHLEINCPSKVAAQDLTRMLEKSGISARVSERKGGIVVYIKESEAIVDFLRLTGASSALLDFENVRIVKSVRNQVNRLVNCETANLEKTVAASWRQTQTITKLIDKVGLEGIPESVRDVAVLRLRNPDLSLKELGGMMEPPLSKSGVAYRMRRLETMARKILGDTI